MGREYCMWGKVIMQAGYHMPVSTWDAILKASSQMVPEIELAPHDYTLRCTRCPQKQAKSQAKILTLK